MVSAEGEWRAASITQWRLKPSQIPNVRCQPNGDVKDRSPCRNRAESRTSDSPVGRPVSGGEEKRKQSRSMKENTRTPGLDPVKRIHTGTEEGGDPSQHPTSLGHPPLG